MTRRREDAGSAAIEFVVIGVGLVLPLAFAIQAAATVHAGAMAAGVAAREAARAFTTAPTVEQGHARGLAAAHLAFADHGLDAPVEALTFACEAGPCLAPGSTVVVRLDWTLPLPYLPGSAGVRLTTEQRMPVDDYRAEAA